MGFSDDGVFVLPSPVDYVSAVAFHADGKLVVSGGDCCGGGSEIAHAAARLTSTGVLDPPVGDEGIVVPNHPSTLFTGTGASDVAVAPDGAIVTAGASTYLDESAAIRYVRE